MSAPATTQYVAVLESEGPGTSRPVLATSDPATVEAVIKIIRNRMAQMVPGRSDEPHRIESEA